MNETTKNSEIVTVVKAKCENCGKIFPLEKVIYDSDEEMDFCPECGEGGCISEFNSYFEWNYVINDAERFNGIIKEINDDKVCCGCFYETLARYFYSDNEHTYMVELQVSTSKMIEETLTAEMWLECYAVDYIGDYDTSHELDTTIGTKHGFTFENTEQLMEEYVIAFCKKEMQSETKTVDIIYGERKENDRETLINT